MSNWTFMSLFPEKGVLESGVVNKFTSGHLNDSTFHDNFIKGYKNNLIRGVVDAIGQEKTYNLAREVKQQYNLVFEALNKEFPLTVDAYWQALRRGSAHCSLPFSDDATMAKFLKEFVTSISTSDPGPHINLERLFSPDATDDMPFEIDPTTEEIVASRKYAKEFVPFDREPKYNTELKDFNKILGLQSYVFNGCRFEDYNTIWDLREKSAPKLKL